MWSGSHAIVCESRRVSAPVPRSPSSPSVAGPSRRAAGCLDWGVTVKFVEARTLFQGDALTVVIHVVVSGTVTALDTTVLTQRLKHSSLSAIGHCEVGIEPYNCESEVISIYGSADPLKVYLILRNTANV